MRNLADPFRSKQHKLYHFDMKQGEARGERKERNKAADLTISVKLGTRRGGGTGGPHMYSSHFSKVSNNNNTKFLITLRGRGSEKQRKQWL